MCIVLSLKVDLHVILISFSRTSVLQLECSYKHSAENESFLLMCCQVVEQTRFGIFKVVVFMKKEARSIHITSLFKHNKAGQSQISVTHISLCAARWLTEWVSFWLRNLSSDKQKNRQAMRNCRGLIDSLISYVQACADADRPDDKVRNRKGVSVSNSFSQRGLAVF